MDAEVVVSKIKFNLFGNNFTHTTGGNKGYSAHGKKSKYIEWVFDNTGNIYSSLSCMCSSWRGVDYFIFLGRNNFYCRGCIGV